MYVNVTELDPDIAEKRSSAYELENKLLDGQEKLKPLLEERGKYLEDFNFHLAEGSNAYALGDRATWLFHKNLREPLGIIINPIRSAIEKAKNENAKIVKEINILNDAIDKHDGNYFEYHGDVLGTAAKTISFPDNTPEWHAQRLKGIGGSDVGAIMGVSPWTTRTDLFLVKSGQVVADNVKTTSGALWRGTMWEDYIARQFAVKNSESKLVHCKASWVNNDRSHQFSNLDGLLYVDGQDTPNSILEIKTSSTPDSWTEDVPPYYRLQVLWYMDAFGIKKGTVMVLIDDTEYKQFEVIPKAGEMDLIHEKVDKFVAEVEDFKVNGPTITEEDRAIMESLRPKVA